MKKIHLLNILLVPIMGVVTWIELHAAVRLTALIGVVWLASVLIAPRLIEVKFLARYKDIFIYISSQRKYFGLWAAGWLTAHALLSTYIYFDGPLSLLAQVNHRPVLILELASLAILLLLALLSNNWSREHIRYWKQIQTAIWTTPAMALVSSIIAAQTFLGQLPLLLIAPILLGFCIIVGITTLFIKSWRSIDWFRFGFLVGGGMLAVGVLLMH